MPKQRKAPKGCYWRDGTFYARIQTGGQDVRWSLRTDDPKVAASRRKAERDRVVAAQRFGDHRRTITEVIEPWGRSIAQNIGPKTLKRYLSSLTIWHPFLDGLYVDEIDKKLIGSFVETRRDTAYIPVGKKHPIKVTTATIKRDLTALSSVCDFCVDEGWLQTNPVRDWLNPAGRRKSRLQERRDPIVLPEMAHVKMVIERTSGLFAKMIQAAVQTGLREDELAKALRQHFNRDLKQLTVIGKRNKLRVIDLEDGGEDFGFELFSNLPVKLETNALFWHRLPEGKRRGGQPACRPYSQSASNFGRIVDATAKQAQKQAQDFRPFAFHHLRHLHAVNWLKSGRSIYALQQRLGHTSVKTTEMYLAYLTPEEKQRAMFGSSQSGTKTGTNTEVTKGQKRKKSPKYRHNLKQEPPPHLGFVNRRAGVQSSQPAPAFPHQNTRNLSWVRPCRRPSVNAIRRI
jgi:integrase/recombinase XerD